MTQMRLVSCWTPTHAFTHASTDASHGLLCLSGLLSEFGIEEADTIRLLMDVKGGMRAKWRKKRMRWVLEHVLYTPRVLCCFFDWLLHLEVLCIFPIFAYARIRPDLSLSLSLRI